MAPSKLKSWIHRHEREQAEREGGSGAGERGPPSSQAPSASMARDFPPSLTPSVYWDNESVTSQDMTGAHEDEDPNGGRSPLARPYTPSHASPSGRSGRRSATPISPVHSTAGSPSTSPTLSAAMPRRRRTSRLSEGLSQTFDPQDEDMDEGSQGYGRYPGSQSPTGYRTQSPPSSYPAAIPPSMSTASDFYARSSGPTQAAAGQAQTTQSSQISDMGSWRSYNRNLPTQSQPEGAPYMNPIPWQPSPPEWPPLHQGPSPPTPSPPHTQGGREDRTPQPSQSSEISGMGSFRSQIRNLPTQSQPDGAPWRNPISWQPSPPEWPPLHQGPSPPTPSPPHTQESVQTPPAGNARSAPIGVSSRPGPSSTPAPQGSASGTRRSSRFDPNRRLWELRAQELTDAFGTRIADMEGSENILAPYPESSPPSPPGTLRIPQLPLHPRITGLRATEWLDRAGLSPIPIFDIYEVEDMDPRDGGVLRISHDYPTNLTYAERRHSGPAP